AAKSFAKGLKSGGLLTIDYLNREYSLERQIPKETVHRGDYEFYIERKLEDNYFIKDIRFRDINQNLRHYTEAVAAFTLADFIRMFRKAGMSLIATFGDYELNSYHPLDTPRMI